MLEKLLDVGQEQTAVNVDVERQAILPFSTCQ